MLDLFELQEQFVGVMILPSAELTAVIGQNGGDSCVVGLKEGQDIVVEHMHSGDRHLIGIQPAPGIAAVAVHDSLQIDLPDTFQVTDKERINSHQIAGIPCFDVPFTKLRRELLQRFYLFIGQLHRLSADVLFQAKQPFITDATQLSGKY